MHIQIHHRTTYKYDTPISSIIQNLRLTPRNHESQNVRNWRIDFDHDVLLQKRDDAFGNVVHMLSLSSPLDSLTITVDGEVETQETHGVVRGTYERFPVGLYLRATPLTEPNAAITSFAKDVATKTDPLGQVHQLMESLFKEMKFDDGPTDATTTAAEAFEQRRGVCQDISHIFLASARSLGIPARYVGGHMFRKDGEVQQEAGHAWVEAYVPDLGWIGLDPTNGISQSEAYVRIAVGLDYLGAAPVRGSRQGIAKESLDVHVAVGQAGQQQQS